MPKTNFIADDGREQAIADARDARRAAFNLIEDAVRAREALRESEEKYRGLFESIDEGVCTIEILLDDSGKPRDYRFLEYNPMFEALTGLGDTAGKTALELVPDLEDFWIETYGRVAMTGEAIRFENYAKPMNRWFDVFATRVGDEPSRKIVLVFRNITAIKRSERNLVLLAEVNENLVILTSIDDMMQTVGAKIGKYLDLSICAFVEVNEAKDEAAINYAWHRKGAKDVTGIYRFSEYLTDDFAKAGRAGHAFVVHDTTADLRSNSEQYAALDIGAFLSVPILENGEWKFSLVAYHSQPHPWDADETELLRNLANQIWTRFVRARGEAALRESEERRHLAQDAGNVGVWDWNIVEGKTYWSETMWRLYGEERTALNPDESFWSSRLHASDRERVVNNLNEVVETQADEFRDEFRIIRTDGSIRWVEAMAKVSKGPDGRVIRMYGVNLDITERKEIEERVKLSENQLRLVTNAVPALISYVDSEERYRFVNQQFNDWFGIPTEEFIGRTVRDVFGESAYKVIKPKIDKALSGEQVIFETLLIYRSVGGRYVQVSYMPDIGVDGTVYGYYGLTNDLTELKRSQDLLRSSEERMALMVENVTDYAILSIDSEGLIDGWNSGAELMFGYAAGEIIGRPYDMLFTPEDIARGIPQKEMKTVRQKGRASDDRWHQRKDGSRFYASGVVMPLYVGNELTGYAKIANDLTEKQRQADELQKAHDELEHKVRERTHQLAKANLTLIQEMQDRETSERQRIELLGRLVSGQETERRRIARDLHDQLGQRLTALRLKIASLKEVSIGHDEITSRVERLQELGETLDSEVSFLAWELRPTALDDLGLVDAVGAFVNEWSKHAEIAADFHSAGLSKERLNHETETHLYRITQEALNNIAKHANADFVAVMLEKRGEKVILIIDDNGKGFDVGRMKASGDSEMGLGLIGMSERAELVGGSVEIESAPGKGSTIFVRVPIFKGSSNEQQT